jgi:hypothetical protein|tara:strand:- start:332 stop:526 length:195 start_codon:yes stop_codon:yes gene_type:complete
MIVMDIAGWIANSLVLAISVFIWAVSIFFIMLIIASLKDMAESIVNNINERKQERRNYGKHSST